MASCKGFQVVGCVFQCAQQVEDSLEHYCRCPKLPAEYAKLQMQASESLDDFVEAKHGLIGWRLQLLR